MRTCLHVATAMQLRRILLIKSVYLSINQVQVELDSSRKTLSSLSCLLFCLLEQCLISRNDPPILLQTPTGNYCIYLKLKKLCLIRSARIAVLDRTRWSYFNPRTSAPKLAPPPWYQ